MPLWAVAFVGVILGAGLGLITRWIETRNDEDIDITKSVVISTEEYRSLLRTWAKPVERSPVNDKEES